MTSLVDLMIVLLLLYVIMQFWRIQSQLKGLRHTLGEIAKKIDIPEHPVNDQLRELLREGKDVEAVKLA